MTTSNSFRYSGLNFLSSYLAFPPSSYTLQNLFTNYRRTKFRDTTAGFPMLACESPFSLLFDVLYAFRSKVINFSLSVIRNYNIRCNVYLSNDH